MAKLLNLPSFSDDRGTLTVIEKILPFSIQRVYYIYDTTDLPRACHSHKVGQQALICLHKNCTVEVETPDFQENFSLSNPNECLILDPQEWHKLILAPGAILLVLASTHYNADNYVYTRSDSRIEKCQGGALILGQAQPAPKQLNLKSLAMQGDPKSSGCPTPAEPIIESRVVYDRI